ncbi:GNAT family protein [Candidatus Cloacimonadota bacterium]
MEHSRIRLRALTSTDLPMTLAWHNQEDIVDMYAGHPFPVNHEMEQKWYDKVLTSNIPATVFGIELTESLKLIGISILKDIDLLNRSAETAIYIGSISERGKGLSKEALNETLLFGFNNLGLHRIWLKVRNDNIAAYSLYKKIGFKDEGVLRDAAFKQGCYHDLSILSLLSSEFQGK